jgi:Uma2 family endonuclease
VKAILKPGKNALPPIFDGIPIIYEDDEFEDILMGENLGHYRAGGILFFCLEAHLARRQPGLLAACNLNCYYRAKPKSKKSGRKPYFSADVMVIPKGAFGDQPTSYTIGKDGPPPFFVCEILSQLSGKIRDPIEKPEIYANLGVTEYLLVDELGRFLPQPLLLKTLRDDRTWEESVDDDGGITSRLGFRVIHDGAVRVIDSSTGKAYVRPGEAEEELEALDRKKRMIERRSRTIARRNRVLEQSNERIAADLAKAEAEKKALLEELALLRKKRNGARAD